MDNLLEKETITIGAPARCARHDIILPGHIKDQCYNSWKYAPTIISDRDSVLIGGRIPRKKRCNTINEMTMQDSHEMNYGESSDTRVHH